MSSEQSPAPKPQAPVDALQELARALYIEVCGHVYAVPGGEKPKPMAVAQLCFKLAETFEAANLEFNPVAKAAREAKNKAGVKLDEVQIDFASIGQASKKP